MVASFLFYIGKITSDMCIFFDKKVIMNETTSFNISLQRKEKMDTVQVKASDKTAIMFSVKYASAIINVYTKS